MSKEAKIYTCVADVLGMTPEDITALDEEALLTDKGLDSIQFVQMIVLLEESLEIEILDSDLLLDNFNSKKKIIETLEKYG